MRDKKTSSQLKKEGENLITNSDLLKKISDDLMNKSQELHKKANSLTEKIWKHEKENRGDNFSEEIEIKNYLDSVHKKNKNLRKKPPKGVFLPLILSLFFFSLTAMAQMPTELPWKDLMNVEFEEDEEGESVPIFSKEIQAYNFQTVMVEGFMIPVDVDGNFYVLSAFPYASCFFCGNAGPESVVELRLAKKGQRFQMDDARKFQGMLVLSQTPNGLIYVLEDAELVQ